MTEMNGVLIDRHRRSLVWCLVSSAATLLISLPSSQRAWAQPFREPRVRSPIREAALKQLREAALKQRCAAIQRTAMTALLGEKDVKRARDIQHTVYKSYSDFYGQQHYETRMRLAVVQAHDKILGLTPNQQRKAIEAIRVQQQTRVLKNHARAMRRKQKTFKDTVRSYLKSDDLLRKCKPQYTKAAKGLEDTLGRASSFSAVLYYECGRDELLLEDYKSAHDSFSKASAISSKVYGKSHMIYGRDLCELAWTNMHSGRVEEAQKQLAVVHSIYEKSLSERHAFRMLVLCDLAVCHWRLKDGVEKGKEFARQLHERAAKLRVYSNESRHVPDHIRDLDAVVNCLARLGFTIRAEFASRLLSEQIVKAKANVWHDTVSRCHMQRSQILEELGRWAVAE